VGARLWNGGAPFAYNLEGVYQFGALGNRAIRAYTLSANVGYTWAATRHWQPYVDLKAEIISGDQRQGDGRLQTFNPLFPRGPTSARLPSSARPTSWTCTRWWACAPGPPCA
jgi:hypothetical protein